MGDTHKADRTLEKAFVI